MSEFTFSRDYKKVQWGQTLWLNLLRAFSAGLVVTTIILISGGNTGPNGSPLLAIPFLAPLMYLVALPIFLFAIFFLTKFVDALGGGFASKAALFCTTAFPVLVLIVGDPLVFALHKLKPALVPTERFNFMNFTLCLWVLDPQKVAQDTLS